MDILSDREKEWLNAVETLAPEAIRRSEEYKFKAIAPLSEESTAISFEIPKTTALCFDRVHGDNVPPGIFFGGLTQIEQWQAGIYAAF